MARCEMKVKKKPRVDKVGRGKLFPPGESLGIAWDEIGEIRRRTEGAKEMKDDGR